MRHEPLFSQRHKNRQIKRGEGEAEAATIYGKAHSQNPDLYIFLRQIDTLKKSINQNTTLVLDANQPPFDLLKSGPNKSDNEPKK